MTTTLFSATSNPHIAALETVFTDVTKPVEWLVIAHNDPQMLRSLSSALTGESAAVLQVSQDTWDFEDGNLAEAIEWALQQDHLKNVLLAGSSQAGGSESRASLVSSKTPQGGKDGYARLLAGVHFNNARNRAAQERFAGHVQRMSQIPVVHNRLSNGELAVYGLFYRTDSGLFAAYDAEAGTFRALVAS